MSNQTRTFNLMLLLTRADDVAEQWVAHCLDVDVMSQGNSLKHAYEMGREAVEMVILDDLDAGREPLERSAPREEWEALYQRLQKARPKAYRLSELYKHERKLHFALVPLVLTFEKAVPDVEPSMQPLEIDARLARAA